MAEYNVSSLNTLAFVERSEAMDASERWTNGNVCSEYVRVHERVSNISRKLDGKGFSRGDIFRVLDELRRRYE